MDMKSAFDDSSFKSFELAAEKINSEPHTTHWIKESLRHKHESTSYGLVRTPISFVHGRCGQRELVMNPSKTVPVPFTTKRKP